MMDAVFILSGLLLLFLGGETLLRGSVSLARLFSISKLIIGAVIVGFGTSMPEVSVSIGAILKNSPDIALGNVIGSNIANTLLIIGLSALISPILVMDKGIRQDLFFMMASGLLLLITMWFNLLNFYSGLVFLGCIGLYLWRTLTQKQSDHMLEMELDAVSEKSYSGLVSSLFVILGMLALIGGARLLVEGALSIARSYHISEAVIGLTLVAFGTSLPELAVSIVASYKKHGDVVVGNIIGSNIFNILAILGITLMIKHIPVSASMLSIDIWVMLVSTGVLSFVLLKQFVINRLIATSFILAYAGYTLYLFLQT